MPSPHESTRPVSRTATEPSKPRISLRRISLISAGLISAIGVVLNALAGEAALRLRQPAGQAAVVGLALKLHDNATKQCLIDSNRRNDLLVPNLFEHTDNPLYIFIAGLGHENQSRPRTPHQLVKHPAIHLCHRRQVRDSAVPCYYSSKGSHRE